MIPNQFYVSGVKAVSYDEIGTIKKIKKKKNLEIIQATSAQTSSEETRQTPYDDTVDARDLSSCFF